MRKANPQTNHCHSTVTEIQVQANFPVASSSSARLGETNTPTFLHRRNEFCQLSSLFQGHLAFTRCKDKTDVVCPADTAVLSLLIDNPQILTLSICNSLIFEPHPLPSRVAPTKLLSAGVTRSASCPEKIADSEM